MSPLKNCIHSACRQKILEWITKMAFYPDEKWLIWMDRLYADNYVIVDKFISGELYRRIMNFFSAVENKDKLRKAGIGTSDEFQVDANVRGDFIYWLDRKGDRELAPFFDLMDELTGVLRRLCFLSLSGSEFHLAKYPPGTRYGRHLDQFQGRANRQLTVLIYLNEAWKPGDGGELRIFGHEQDILVEPLARRLLLFKSDIVEHEVLVTRVPRYSLTGWLLHQPASVGNLRV